MKTIAVDLDDTLNDFTATLQGTDFVRDETHALSEETFRGYLVKLRGPSDEGGELLSTEYTFFRSKIHQQCYERARARPDGVAFLRWLREHGWRIVICTQRDLRRAQAGTRQWLQENDVPFDHLFMAGNKIVFCKLWGIGHLVDNDLFNITHGEKYEVKVHYPAAARPDPSAPSSGGPHAARSFKTFDEIIPWIQK